MINCLTKFYINMRAMPNIKILKLVFLKNQVNYYKILIYFNSNNFINNIIENLSGY